MKRLFTPPIRARRDARTDAIAAERFAEDVETDDAWLVAADAWEEAGYPDRARFAYLRRPSNLHGGAVASHDEAIETRRRLDAWHAAELDRNMTNAARGEPTGNIPLSSDERARIERWLGFPPPSNDAALRLALRNFLLEPPEKWFAYYDTDRVGGAIKDFLGGIQGRITAIGPPRRPFGRGGTIRSVTVRAINGYTYCGTCAVEYGTYCRLRRSKPWRV